MVPLTFVVPTRTTGLVLVGAQTGKFGQAAAGSWEKIRSMRTSQVEVRQALVGFRRQHELLQQALGTESVGNFLTFQ